MTTVTKAMPRKSKGDKPRDDKAVKIERALATKAKIIAETEGITIAEYISGLLRPFIERDWPKALKKIGTPPKEGTD